MGSPRAKMPWQSFIVQQWFSILFAYWTYWGVKKKKKQQRMPGYLLRIIKSESLERWVEKKHFIYISFFIQKDILFFFYRSFLILMCSQGWVPLYLQELNANKKRHTYLFQFITYFLSPFFSFIRVIAAYIPKPQLAPPQSLSRTCDATRF